MRAEQGPPEQGPPGLDPPDLPAALDAYGQRTREALLARLDGHLKQTLDHPVADLAEAGRLVRLAAVRDEGA